MPGPEIYLLWSDALLDCFIKVQRADGINVRRAELAAADVGIVGQVPIKEVEEPASLQLAFLSPFRKGFHPVTEVTRGMLKRHACRHHEIEVDPAKPLFDVGFFQRGSS